MKTVKLKTDTGCHELFKATYIDWQNNRLFYTPTVHVSYTSLNEIDDASFELEDFEGPWNRNELIAIKAIIDGALAATKRKPKSRKPKPKRRSRT